MVAAAATAAMAAQSHLQLNQPQQQQERGFLSWFPAANAVDTNSNNPMVATSTPVFITPGSNTIAVATMPLPQPSPHPQQFLNPYSTLPTTCVAPSPLSLLKRKRVGAVDHGFVDATGAVPIATTTGVASLVTSQYLDADIDTLLLQHHASLRAGLQRSARRHCRDLAMAFARRARSRIKAVDAELEAASRRNAELETRVKQLSAESQAWLAVARDNEATVAALRSGLEQAMVAVDQTPLQLGRGGPAADDAQSCCFVGGGDDNVGSDVGLRCRACSRDVDGKAVGSAPSVVVLPCRHLCLCAECDRTSRGTDACPVCGSAKAASIHVIFP